VSTKKTAFKTSISLSPQAKAVCDGFIKKHGLRENITSLSDLVGRALMAYCLPPGEGEKPAGLTSAEGGKRLAVPVSKSAIPADLRDSPQSAAALSDRIRARVKASDHLADRIRNSDSDPI
jgi:hypothetical protein